MKNNKKKVQKEDEEIPEEYEDIDDVVDDDKEEEYVDDEDEEDVEDVDAEDIDDIEDIVYEEEDEEILDAEDEEEEGEADDDVIEIAVDDDVDIESISVQVPDDERITPRVLTRYEMVRVLGIRTKQLTEGAKPLVSKIEGKKPIQIALDELVLKRIPFKIKRQMPYPKFEVWKIAELHINITQDEIDDLIEAIK